MHDKHISTLKRLLSESAAAVDEAGRQLAHANNLRQQAEKVLDEHVADHLHAAGQFSTDKNHPFYVERGDVTWGPFADMCHALRQSGHDYDAIMGRVRGFKDQEESRARR